MAPSILSSFSGLRKPDGMASLAPRRFYYLVAIWLGVAFFLVLGSQYLGGPSTIAQNWRFPFVTDDGTLSIASWGPTKNRKLKVAILESAGVHDEVSSALIAAFGGQRDVDLHVYQPKQRYNMSGILGEFDLVSPVLSRSQADMLQNDTLDDPMHVVVSTTCELDLKHKKHVFETILNQSNSFLFCLVHHANQWEKGTSMEMVNRFAAQNRVDIITLGNHTAEFLKEKAIPKWEHGDKVKVHVLPPIFPVNAPGPATKVERNLAMQGDFSSSRRDYQGIFGGLGGIIEHANTLGNINNVTLHLLGHGKHPKVPDEIRSAVVFDESLSYPNFYSILSTAFAVLPAFATDDYFDRKASSTVPASIIAGAPLIASDALLNAYTYLPREAVWTVEEGESEMDVVKRIIGDQQTFEKKRWLIADTRERLLKENVENVHTWLVEALKRL